MPGLNQLKKFNNDILSLGDELTIRASRSEKPVRVPIPKTVENRDDTEDFVLGMPEVVAPVEDTSVDDDLSDITGMGAASSSSSSKDEPEAPSFEAPDLSSLLNPVIPDAGSSGAAMPDLSQFMDQPEEEVVEEEQAPQEVSVADMSFEDLLSGAGFDGTEGTGEEKQEVSTEPESDFYTIEEEPEEVPAAEPVMPGAPNPLDDIAAPGAPTGNGDALPIDSLLNTPPAEPEPVDMGEIPSFDEAIPAAEDVPSFEDAVPLDEMPSFDEPARAEAMPSFDEPAPVEVPDAPEAAPSFDEPSGLEVPDFGEDAGGDLNSLDDISSSGDFAMPDISDIPDVGPAPDFNDMGGSEEMPDLGGMDNMPSSDAMPDITMPEDAAPGSFDDMDNIGTAAASEGRSDLDSMDLAAAPDGLSDFDNIGTAAASEGLGDLDNIGSAAASGGASSDFGDLGGDFGEGEDFSATEGMEGGEAEGPVEVFDTTGMDEDIDFGIQETDTQLNGGGDDDFDLGGGDFEIPGFSDVETAKDVTGKKGAAKPAASTGPAKQSQPKTKEKEEDLPPNTLSDAQYKRFLANLSDYPLNVRLAFENLIVQDEFTDDAEFEIIEKILNKAPARQVAALLEKMLDTSIPVPRDFEHRTAEEYEAYKKSLSYQLKNKIIPGALVGILILLAGWGLFNFGKHCIYIPLKANGLYKQGYALLQAEEFPQSEETFNQAATVKMQKKWFFKFARGYREKKQYQRAEKIYLYTLKYFNHNKEAGLELADMQLNDLANYERAEEVVRREILDYHINDAVGLLMLGDIFLEWATEKDPSKYEDAYRQYEDLNQLYGKKNPNLYHSRLMRYFIRTDQLRQVLHYKEEFEPKEKSLSGDDWTELSGYLLEKLYGELSPSDEYLRNQIEDVRELLQRSVITAPENPNAWYNLGKYYITTNEDARVQTSLETAITKFNDAPHLKTRELYKFIDSYRLLGENFTKTQNYLQAQEKYTDGITLFTKEKENAGFEGNALVGNLFADLADINYFVAADYANAETNYQTAVDYGYDNAKIRYRLGYIQYNNKDYLKALGSFIKSGEGVEKERNLLLALGNTLALRNDDYAAEGYYEQLVQSLDNEILERKGAIYPQADKREFDLITDYLYATNNYGVILYRLAKRTGDSSRNAKAIVQLQESLRAWDSLTRNQATLVRLGGSNLAEENIKYIARPITEFEPSIYNEIPKTLTDKEKL